MEWTRQALSRAAGRMAAAGDTAATPRNSPHTVLFLSFSFS